jgi:chemosensory pili system protein ChpC
MNDPEASVRCLLLPSNEIALLVPSAAVAEVTAYGPPEPIPDVPDWLLGRVAWREQSIPLVSFATLLDPRSTVSLSPGKMVVLYGLQQPSKRSFFGLQVTGTPRPLAATQASLHTVQSWVDATAIVWVRVQMDAVEAVVADLAALEALLSRHLPISEATDALHRLPPLTAPSRGAIDGG